MREYGPRSRIKKHVDRIKKRMNGHKIIHLTCGWTGDKLSEEGGCPKCRELLDDNLEND